MGKKKFYKNIP